MCAYMKIRHFMIEPNSGGNAKQQQKSHFFSRNDHLAAAAAWASSEKVVVVIRSENCTHNDYPSVGRTVGSQLCFSRCFAWVVVFLTLCRLCSCNIHTILSPTIQFNINTITFAIIFDQVFIFVRAASIFLQLMSVKLPENLIKITF